MKTPISKIFVQMMHAQKGQEVMLGEHQVEDEWEAQESLDGRLCELQGMKHLKILSTTIFSDGMMLFDGLYIMGPNIVWLRVFTMILWIGNKTMGKEYFLS